MSIIGLIILLVIVGAALYLLQLVPMDPTIKTVIKVIVVVVLIVYAILFLAGLAGLTTGLPGVRDALGGRMPEMPAMSPRLRTAVEREIARWTPPFCGVDAADYRQEALLAWWHVSQRYDPTRPARLETYGWLRVLGRVKDMRDWATHHAKVHYWSWPSATALMLPTAYGQALRRARFGAQTSVPPVEREVWLRRHVNRLPPRWRFVVIRRYWSGWTLQAIGRALGCSDPRVVQIHQKALLTLRSVLRHDVSQDGAPAPVSGDWSTGAAGLTVRGRRA